MGERFEYAMVRLGWKNERGVWLNETGKEFKIIWEEVLKGKRKNEREKVLEEVKKLLENWIPILEHEYQLQEGLRFRPYYLSCNVGLRDGFMEFGERTLRKFQCKLPLFLFHQKSHVCFRFLLGRFNTSWVEKRDEAAPKHGVVAEESDERMKEAPKQGEVRVGTSEEESDERMGWEETHKKGEKKEEKRVEEAPKQGKEGEKRAKDSPKHGEWARKCVFCGVEEGDNPLQFTKCEELVG